MLSCGNSLFFSLKRTKKLSDRAGGMSGLCRTGIGLLLGFMFLAKKDGTLGMLCQECYVVLLWRINVLGCLTLFAWRDVGVWCLGRVV